jgi:hypothetical protein
MINFSSESEIDELHNMLRDKYANKQQEEKSVDYQDYFKYDLDNTTKPDETNIKLKPKTNNSFVPPMPSFENIQVNEPNTREDDSMISISSLKDLQNSSVPQKGRRKNRSDKNRVSLDI